MEASSVKYYEKSKSPFKKVDFVKEMPENSKNYDEKHINTIINCLEKSNKTPGIFDLIESKNIYENILTLKRQENNEKFSEALDFLIKASIIANKRGSFSLEESYNLAIACENLKISDS